MRGELTRAGRVVRLTRDDLEGMLVEVWSDVLGIPSSQIEPDANFFALGGDSMTLVQVVARVNETLNPGDEDAALPITTFFTYTTVASLAGHIAEREGAAVSESQVASAIRDTTGAVAIIAMVGRFPGAATAEQFWENLCAGIESLEPLEDIDLFDAAFFGLTPREAGLMCPEQRLLLECSQEVLDRAGYGVRDAQIRVGVFVAAGQSGYAPGVAAPDSEVFEASGGFAAIVANTSPATRISYLLDLRGPSYSVDTACSSSLVAVHEACRSLLHGECEMALAGGVSSLLLGREKYPIQAGGMRSLEGHCRPFDERADGAVFMPGIGLVVLKRLEDAQRDLDTIVAVIRGSAVNNDGKEKIGYTAPGVGGQARVIRDALVAAHVEPDSIRYIETHGTGTRLGDSIEIAALRSAFEPCVSQRDSCTLGALKANVGHLEVAAGIAGLIKAACVVRYGEFPPAIHYAEPNQEIELGTTPFRINVEREKWPEDGRPRRAGVSSFGIGGTNVHVILEEPPEIESSAGAREAHLLPISARSADALVAACRNLAAWIDRPDPPSIEDIAFTLQAGRVHYPFREFVVATCAAEASEALLLKAANVSRNAVRHGSAAIVFVFPAVASQIAAIARALYRSERVFRETFDRCAECLASGTRAALQKLLHADADTDADTEAAVLDAPGLFVLQYATARVLISCGVTPSLALGYGVGEHVAACIAGVASPESAMELIAGGSGEGREGQGALSDGLPARAIALEIGSGAFTSQLREQSVFPDMTLIALGETLRGNPATLLPDTLGQLWRAGAAIDWRAFNADAKPMRVPLPGYPFERQRYWRDATRGVSLYPALVKHTDVRDWLYLPAWLNVGRASSSEPTAENPRVSGCCLLFDDDTRAGEALAAALSERFERVIRVCPAPVRCEAEGKAALCPTSPDDYLHLLEALKDLSVDTIVYAWGLEQPARTEHETLHAVLHLCQALQSELATAAPALLFVTSHGFEVGEAAAIDPLSATFAAMAGVIAKELPRTRCRALDVCLPSDDEGLKLLAQQVASEAVSRRCDEVMAIRGTSLWCRTLVPARATRALSENRSLLRERGVYLITGGTGGVGLALAERLATRWHANLVLMARTAPECAEHEASLLADTDARSVCESIRRLRGADAEVALFRGDVTDPHQVQRAVQFVEERFGRLDGVIHAAGIVDDGVIPLKSPASVSRVLGPKIAGTRALWDAVQPLQPEFFVCCSSLSAVITPAGQLDYAAANAFQDAFAHAQDGKTRTRVISINWDGWRDIGMAADLAKRHGGNGAPPGVRGLTATDGQDLLELILGNPQPQWVVSTREPVESAGPSASKSIAPVARTAWTPTVSAVEGAPGDVAMTAPERAIAEVWHDLLGREGVSAHDNFIALGGDSLLVIQMASQIESRLGRAIPVRELMRNPTVSGIAKLLTT